MARDYTNQHTENYGGSVHDFGLVTFSGTDAELEITTTLSKITGVSFTSASAMTTGNTVDYFLNETYSGGAITVSGGSVTLKRIAEGSGTATSGMSVFYHFIGID